jgi:hypothetical protein
VTDLLTIAEVAELLSPTEVAAEFRVSRALVYRAILAGELPASPQPYRVNRADAAKWRAPILREAAPTVKRQQLPKGRRRKSYPLLGIIRNS